MDKPIDQEGKEQRTGIFERSVTTDLLVSFLKDLGMNESVSYDELSNVAGLPVQANVEGSGYHHLFRARQILEREGIFFDVLHGRGLKRIPEETVANAAPRHVKLIHKKAKTVTRRLARLDRNNMSPFAKNNWDLGMTLARMVELSTRPAMLKKVQKQITSVGGRLKLDQTLKLFGGKKES